MIYSNQTYFDCVSLFVVNRAAARFMFNNLNTVMGSNICADSRAKHTYN